jgi:hypothetical protein
MIEAIEFVSNQLGKDMPLSAIFKEGTRNKHLLDTVVP